MVIQCTNCKAKFRVPDSKIKKDQTKVRCAKCEQIFVAKIGENVFSEEARKPKASERVPEPPPNDLPEAPIFKESELSFSQESSIKDLIQEELKGSGDEKSSRADEFPDPDTANLPKEQLEEMKESGDDSAMGSSMEVPIGRIELKKMPAGGRQQARRGKEYNFKKSVYSLYPLVLCLAFIAGLFMVGLTFPFKDTVLLGSSVPGSIKPGLTITKIQSETVSTVSGDTFFVIRGDIFNNSNKPKAKINLQGELYSTNNLFIVKEQFPCCLGFSKETLHEISNLDSFILMYKKDQIEELKPYQRLPFTLVFKKPDEFVKSFRVNILNE